MPSEWKELRWGDVATLEYGKALRSYQDCEGKYPVYGTNGLIGWTDSPLYNREGVIVGRKGAYRGVHFSPVPFFVIDTAFYLKPKIKELNMRFAYYQLLTQNINAMDSGSAIPSTSRPEFYNLTLKLPSLHEQEAIAHLLGAIDDKIELNRRMNMTLEAVGGALFRRWFVDFEFPNQEGKPYKSTGGKMQYNEELDSEIPEGWSVRTLSNFIKFIKGKKPVSVSTTQESSFVPLILIDSLNGNQEAFAKDKDGVLVEETDTLMVMDGASSGRVERGKKGLLGSTLARIETSQKGKAYLYHFLKEKEIDINENTTGTSIPHADKGKINGYQIVFPNDDGVISQFETISNTLLLKSINNSNQNKTLQNIRDSLLPKLMSGKIRVPLNKENLEVT